MKTKCSSSIALCVALAFLGTAPAAYAQASSGVKSQPAAPFWQNVGGGIQSSSSLTQSLGASARLPELQLKRFHAATLDLPGCSRSPPAPRANAWRVVRHRESEHADDRAAPSGRRLPAFPLVESPDHGKRPGRQAPRHQDLSRQGHRRPQRQPAHGHHPLGLHASVRSPQGRLVRRPDSARPTTPCYASYFTARRREHPAAPCAKAASTQPS